MPIITYTVIEVKEKKYGKDNEVGKRHKQRCKTVSEKGLIA